MKHTRQNINNETLFRFYEKLTDDIRAASDIRRDIEAWHRHLDEAALERVLAKLNEAENV